MSNKKNESPEASRGKKFKHIIHDEAGQFSGKFNTWDNAGVDLYQNVFDIEKKNKGKYERRRLKIRD